MPNGNREDRSYVDGLPVKITEKYKRPPRIKLPLACQNCSPNPIINEEYDFRLERSVLSKMEAWKKARLEQAQWREERRKKLEEEDEAAKSKDSEEQQEVPCVGSTTQPSILTPIYAESMSQPALKPLPHYFNFSEFESDNSSPFDNMELKTINDMEVLASVLSSSSDAVPPNDEKTSHSLINNNFIPNKNGVIYNKWEGYNTYSSPQYYEQNYSYPAMYSPVVYPQQSQPHWYGGDSVSTQPSPYYPSSSTTSTPAHEYHVDAGGTIPKVKEESCSLPNQRSNSKSVPDLVLELEEELKEKRFFDEQRRKTKTPPPRPSLLNSTGLENWKPWPELESPHRSSPDVFETLTAAEQVLARNVSEMGFPVARVVRTIKKFQGDDKKVIDFLLQVQRLEEESFPGDLAERALHANNNDPEKTKKHLEGVVTLLDLGFDADSIEKALIETNNDRDSALERLIS